MKGFNQKLPKTIKFIANIVAVLVLLTAVIGLNVLVQRSSNSKNTPDKQTERLNIAVVNEDKTIVDKNRRYNLGADYIKNIERDDSQNWTVASRSAAEAGLRDGSYQLAVYIPSNFSSKILDIDSIAVDKTTVTYKVNAKGNSRVEAAANKVGSSVVSHLNSQLVNMYLASILGNLYTAQQNAKQVSNMQNKNIKDYSGGLYESSLAFPNVFPSLVSLSNSSLSANNSLSKLLNSTANNAKSGGTDFSTLLSDFNNLVSQYSKGNISEKAFREGLIQIDPEQLSSQVQASVADLKNLQTEQKELSGLVNSQKSQERQDQVDANLQAGDSPEREHNDDVGEEKAGSKDNITNLQQSKAYQDLTEDLNKQLDDLEKRLDSAVKKDTGNVKEIKDLVNEELARYYGKELDKLDSISVGDLLGQTGNGLATGLEDYKKSINNMVATSIAALPAANPADLGNLKGVTERDYSADLPQNFVTHGYQASDSNGLKDKLTNAASALRDYNTNSVNATTDVTTKVQARLQVSGTAVDTWYVVTDGQSQTPVSANTPIEVDLSKKNEFHYNIKSSSGNENNNQEADGHNTDSDHTASIQLSLGGVQVGQPKTFDLNDYRSKVEAYAAVAQEVADTYKNASNLLTVYYPNGSEQNLTDSFFNQSAKQLLTNLLTQALQESLNTYSANKDVTEAVASLKSTRENLIKNMQAVQEKNNKLATDISSAVSNLEKLSGNSAGEGSSVSKKPDQTADKAKKSSDLSSKLSKLLSQSESLKTAAASNAKAASSVSSTFESFSKAAKKAEDNSKKMSADAQKLMNKFNGELAQSNDFVKSFVKVLDNAYKNGVPNEALLEFLSTPVAARTTSYKSRINTYRPFAWVLLLAVITLFSAYLFATQDLVQRVKNKFIKGLFADTDPLNVGALSALAFVEGLILGIASGRAMTLDRALLPSWILLFVLFSFVLLHVQYFLLKHMKVLGMGLLLYNLISFIYFSNAVGTTVASVGLAQKLKSFNILTIMETKLTLYFDNITADAGLILALLAAAVIAIILNTLVRFPWENKAHSIAKNS